MPRTSTDRGTLAKKKKCAGLKGEKLRRCKALAKCKKLRGKRRKKCLAKARRIGVRKKQAPPTFAPPKIVPPPAVPPPPASPPPPAPPAPPANRAPQWPNPFQFDATTSFQYDSLGRLAGATTTINVLTPATDPDGDPLTYAWSASNGSITGTGLSATWTRVIEFGRVKSGTATVTASDGKGASTPFDLRFL